MSNDVTTINELMNEFDKDNNITIDVNENNININDPIDRIYYYHDNFKYNVLGYDENVIDIDTSYYANNNLKFHMFEIDFLTDFIDQLSELKKTNHKLEQTLLTEQIFKINCRYKYNSEQEPYYYNSILEKSQYYEVTYKLDFSTNITNIKDITFVQGNVEGNVQGNVEEFKTNFTNIFNTWTINKLDYFSKNDNDYLHLRANYYKLKFYKLILNYYMTLELYKLYGTNEGQKKNDIEKILNNFNNTFKNININLSSILNNLEENKPSEENEHDSDNKQISDAVDYTSKLYNINNIIEDKQTSIKKLNNENENEKQELYKINIIFIISIILFILLIIFCIIVYFSHIEENENIKIVSIILFVITLIIFTIIIYLLKYENSIIERFEDIYTNNISQISHILDNIKNIEEIENINLTYYSIINPHLKNEYRKYDDKKKKILIYDKLAKFNLNINNYDKKFNIVNIIYLLIIVLLISLSIVIYLYLPDYINIIGIILLVLFIIITIMYCVEIIMIVNTDANKYYWINPSNNLIDKM